MFMNIIFIHFNFFKKIDLKQKKLYFYFLIFYFS